jgi:hypothetical protein
VAVKVETHVLTVDSVPYVIGMEWSVGLLARQDADKRKAIESVGSHYGVLVKGPNEFRIGIAAPSAKGKLSAAAVLAKRQPNIILVQQVSQDQYWFVYISRGMIYPRSDFVGTITAVQERIKDVTSKVSTVEEDMRTCAPGLSSVPMFEKFEPSDFVTLIGDYQPSKPETVRSLAPVVTRERVVVGGFLAVLAFVLISGHTSKNNIVKTVQTAVTPTPAPTMNEQQRQQKFDTLIAVQLNSEQPTPEKQRLSELVGRFWPSLSGWELETVSLGGNDPGTVVLKRLPSATAGDLVRALGGDGTASFSDDGSSATIVMQRKAGAADAPAAISLRSARDAHLELESAFESRDIKVNIQQGTITSATPGMDLRQTLMLGPTDPLPGQLYEWETDVPYSMLDSVFSILQKYPTIGLAKLVYKRSADSETVGLSGVMYEPL